MRGDERLNIKAFFPAASCKVKTLFLILYFVALESIATKRLSISPASLLQAIIVLSIGVNFNLPDFTILYLPVLELQAGVMLNEFFVSRNSAKIFFSTERVPTKGILLRVSVNDKGILLPFSVSECNNQTPCRLSVCPYADAENINKDKDKTKNVILDISSIYLKVKSVPKRSFMGQKSYFTWSLPILLLKADVDTNRHIRRRIL